MKRWFILVFVLVLLVSCSKPAENSQLANPASVYCEEQNGTLEIRNTEQGQVGHCLMNGKECEEWAYFGGECSLE